MKAFIFLVVALLGCGGVFGQTDDNLICKVKKDYRATNLHRQKETTLLRAGEQYPVLGTSGKMVVIKVGSKSYFMSVGSIDIFKVAGQPGAGLMKSDTVAVGLDRVGRFE